MPPEPQLTPPIVQNPLPPKQPRWLWPVVIGTAVVALAGIVVAAMLLLRMSAPSNTTNKPAAQQLTIGSFPYIYPCSVATMTDYKTAFMLDNDQIATVSETSAVPAAAVSGETDLLKIAKDDSYRASCSLTGGRKGKDASLISVDIRQFPTEKDASSQFASQRELASGGFGGTSASQLSALPGFADTSFVEPPAADDTFKTQTATLQHKNAVIELKYQLAVDETTDATTQHLNTFAQSIMTKANQQSAYAVKDLTGQASFVGLPFVDVCPQLDLASLAKQTDDISLRADDMLRTSTYAALLGSRAADDGAFSTCQLDFRTTADATAQKALANASLSLSQAYPHQLSFRLHRYTSTAEAALVLNDDQKNYPSAQTLSGFGEKAYKAHEEKDVSTTDKVKRTLVTDRYAIIKGRNALVISFAQIATSSPYTTVPLTITDMHAQRFYNAIDSVLAKHQK